MAAESIISLKKQAVKLGMDQDEARAAGRKVLTDFIASGGSKPKPVAKKKAAAKKKGTTARKSTSSRKTSERRPARKRKTTAAARPAKRNNGNDDTGRAEIGTLKWKSYDKELWNPREDSTVGIIFRALQKVKGDVDAVFKSLKKDIKQHVNMTKRDGTKRSKEDAENRLRYNISRTKFLFATQTGQHQSGTNRVKYGKGPYAQAKPAARKRSTTKKSGTSKKRTAAKKSSTRRRTTRRKTR